MAAVAGSCLLFVVCRSLIDVCCLVCAVGCLWAGLLLRVVCSVIVV